MPLRVEVEPSLLAWAVERSGRDPAELIRRFPKLAAWERGELQPTMRQLEDFARSTRTPVGYLLLAEPPHEEVPIPDFRTIGDVAVERPSADLLETLAIAEQRQAWFQDFARSEGHGPLPFVGAATPDRPVAETAEEMRHLVGFDLDSRASYVTWTQALRGLADGVEEAGVLVMSNGIVGSNTHRKLNPDEFRGFALVDDIAPVVFINAADTKAAQIFTLAHELAHVWLGQSALDNPQLQQAGAIAQSVTLASRDDREDVERWCNEVAAEVLVPRESLREEFQSAQPLHDEVGRLARRYKVSTLVVLRSIFDAGYLSWDAFRSAYLEELEHVREVREADGGDFYRTQPVRVSKRFARAVIASTLEGHTLYSDAFRLLGFRKQSTFDELSRRLGVA